MPGDSRQHHLFPNEHWNDGRADTPFTSPPLDDDFDAITQRWSRTTKATTVEPTSSGLPNGHWNDGRADTPFTSPPLNDDFDAITQRWSKTTKATTVEPTSSGLCEQLEAATRATTPAVAGFNPRRRRKGTNHGDEIPREPGVIGQGKGLRRMRAKDRIKSGGVNEGARPSPLAGQDYEMLEYRVLEEGPERTVSISTWREQAIQETDSDDEMSVYYVNAGDCLQLGDTTAEFVSFPLRTTDGMGLGSYNLDHRDQGSNGKHRGPQVDGVGFGSYNLGYRDQGSSGKHRGPQDPPISAERFASAGSKTYAVSKDASPSLHSSAPRTSTPRGSGTLVVQNLDAPADISHTMAGSSPFHATKSGSTISSIHVSSTPTLDHLLLSCEPSLIHISPILQRVGIMRAEHLRAVGKLSEDIRNKVVKDEVLRLGVTVVEWAILLDKLQSL
ncbi:hypothetical protein C8R44DRAFT_772416 [Mycena epipterygia]|nr:hypothetical protein C8R44DRAFT_772416 [Mycena epipterygia]